MEDVTYLEEIESEDCPFKFPKDLLTIYQPKRLNEKTEKSDAIV